MSLRQRLERAVQLHQAGRYDDAIAGYRDVLAESPESVDALHLLGVALEQAGHPAEGKPLVELAIRREPGIAAYRNSLGNIHRALGDHGAARIAFGEALKLDATSTDALNNLGLLAQRDEDWDAAADHFRAALAAEPAFLPARFNLATTAWLAGRHDEAVAAFTALLAQAPHYAGQLVGLAKRSLGAKDIVGTERLLSLLAGNIGPADRDLLTGGLATLKGDYAAAEAHYRDALAAAPGDITLLRNLGQLLMDRSAHAEAIPLLERALALQPDAMPIVTALGVALSRMAADERAIPLLRRVVADAPDSIGAWADLAMSFSRLQWLDEACDAMARVIALDPERAENYAAMGGLEGRRGNLAAGEGFCLEALKRDPTMGAALGNLANIRGVQRRFDEAISLFRQHLALEPEDGSTHSNLSFTLLRLGRYQEGWKHFGWRWKSKTWTSSDAGQRGLPRWNGENPAPGRILIWREQGIGDQILYASLLPELAARGFDIVLAVDPRLVPLFARSLPGIEVVADADSLDLNALRLTCQCPLGDLAPLCRPDAGSFAAHPARYLRADPDRTAMLRARYRNRGGERLVGISWNSGNPQTGRHKSISVSDMTPLLREPETRFVSLQYGAAAADLHRLPPGSGETIYRDPEIDPLLDIDAQAAQIAALDLVVTVSTSAAHLAAALGVPTLILLPEDWGQLWYWGHGGERTPWYSQVRLCRGETGERANDIVDRALPMFRAMLARN